MNKTAVLYLILFAAVATAFAIPAEGERAMAITVDFETVGDGYVRLFEERILSEKVVSGKSAEEIEDIARKLKVSPRKAKCLMCLRAAVMDGGGEITLEELARKSDAELTGIFVSYYKEKAKTMSRQQKKAVGEEFRRLKREEPIKIKL